MIHDCITIRQKNVVFKRGWKKENSVRVSAFVIYTRAWTQWFVDWEQDPCITVFSRLFSREKNFAIFTNFCAVTRKYYSRKRWALYYSIPIVACGCIRNQPLQWSTKIFSAKFTMTELIAKYLFFENNRLYGIRWPYIFLLYSCMPMSVRTVSVAIRMCTMILLLSTHSRLTARVWSSNKPSL